MTTPPYDYACACLIILTKQTHRSLVCSLIRELSLPQTLNFLICISFSAHLNNPKILLFILLQVFNVCWNFGPHLASFFSFKPFYNLSLSLILDQWVARGWVLIAWEFPSCALHLFQFRLVSALQQTASLFYLNCL